MGVQHNSSLCIRLIPWLLLLATCAIAQADSGVMTVTPASVAGDAALSNPVTLCISGGAGGLFITGRPITWTANLAGYGGSVTLDGHTGVSGTLNAVTNNSGCATISSLATTGLATTGSTYSPSISFKATSSQVPYTTYQASLQLNVALSLSVNQSQWYGNVSSATVQATLRNLNATGNVADVPVQASCTGYWGMTVWLLPSVQSVNGTSNPSTLNFTLSASNAEIAAPVAGTPNATCTLSVLPFGPSETLTISGTNVCLLTRLSPPDPRCGGPSN